MNEILSDSIDFSVKFFPFNPIFLETVFTIWDFEILYLIYSV